MRRDHGRGSAQTRGLLGGRETNRHEKQKPDEIGKTRTSGRFGRREIQTGQNWKNICLRESKMFRRARCTVFESYTRESRKLD